MKKSILKRIVTAIKNQIIWWKTRAAFSEQRRQQELRATSVAVAMTCTGALRR